MAGNPRPDSFVPRVGRAVLAAGSVVCLAALLVGGPAAVWVFALVSLLLPPALIALSVPAGRPGMVVLLVGLVALLEGSAVAILSLGAASSQPYFFGLPLSTLIMLVGLGLAPLVLVGLGHAITFEPPSGDTEPDHSRSTTGRS